MHSFDLCITTWINAILKPLSPTLETHDLLTCLMFCCSDQTDPFNRQPLSMEMIVPAEELKAEITSWLLEKGLSL